MKTDFLPLLAVQTADWVFGSILSLLTLVLILLVTVALRRRAARRRETPSPASGTGAVPAPTPAAVPAPPVYVPTPAAVPAPPVYVPAAPAAPAERREGLMGSLVREEEAEAKAEPAKEPTPAERPLDEKSIDKRFAEHRGQWICRYCETINEPGMVLCQACGQPRNGN